MRAKYQEVRIKGKGIELIEMPITNVIRYQIHKGHAVGKTRSIVSVTHYQGHSDFMFYGTDRQMEDIIHEISYMYDVDVV